jgi:hypothetical protein
MKSRRKGRIEKRVNPCRPLFHCEIWPNDRSRGENRANFQLLSRCDKNVDQHCARLIRSPFSYTVFAESRIHQVSNVEIAGRDTDHGLHNPGHAATKPARVRWRSVQRQ